MVVEFSRSDRLVASFARVMGGLLVVTLGCRPDPHEPTSKPTDLTWMPGDDRSAEDQASESVADASEVDEGDDYERCQADPEARGCPWARLDASYDDDGVWGNRDAQTEVPAPKLPERCPETAVFGDLLEIPAGPFTMGCDEADSEVCGKDERTRTVVELPAFAIDRTEVTQAAYARCVSAGVCTPPAGGFYPTAACTYPVVNVDWQQASEYCAWLDRRLPTEAEWEKAARGTDGRRYPWGNEAPTCDLANYEGCGGEMVPVDTHDAGASPYGVQHMAGNVREWVFDSAEGRGRKSKRAIRGGMYNDRPEHIRVTRRTFGDISVSDLGIGFRCAK